MRKFLIIITIAALICGSVFIYQGYDKKDNYYNGSYRSTNAYVGGDAYNYIVNANYFTGYMVLGIGCYVVALLAMVGSAILSRMDDEKENTAAFRSAILHPLQGQPFPPNMR